MRHEVAVMERGRASSVRAGGNPASHDAGTRGRARRFRSRTSASHRFLRVTDGPSVFSAPTANGAGPGSCRPSVWSMASSFSSARGNAGASRRLTRSFSSPVPWAAAGSSGKQVLGIVALIAASALALWAGPAIAGTLFGGSALAGGLITAGITVGASLLINALVAPKAGGQADSTQDSTPQAFSLSAAGNSARALQTIPVSYGRLRKYCDFATLPWSDFIGDDQYLNVLLCEGSGRYDHEQVLIDDTILWDRVNGVNPDFDAQVAFYDPGQTVTLFPVNVTTATEVNGQQLPPGTGGQPVDNFPQPGPWIGGFIANSPGTLADTLALDFAFPAGCFLVDAAGNYQSRPVRVGRRSIDQSMMPAHRSSPAGSQLFDTLANYNTRKPQKFSRRLGPAPGRYEVRVRRYGVEAADFDPKKSGPGRLRWPRLAATARVSAGQCQLR